MLQAVVTSLHGGFKIADVLQYIRTNLVDGVQATVINGVTKKTSRLCGQMKKPRRHKMKTNRTSMTARETLYMSTNNQDQHDGERDALHECKQAGPA